MATYITNQLNSLSYWVTEIITSFISWARFFSISKPSDMTSRPWSCKDHCQTQPHCHNKTDKSLDWKYIKKIRFALSLTQSYLMQSKMCLEPIHSHCIKMAKKLTCLFHLPHFILISKLA